MRLHQQPRIAQFARNRQALLRKLDAGLIVRAIKRHFVQPPQDGEEVRRLLHLSGLPGTDAADALGLAITHAHAGATMAQLAKSTELLRKSHALYRGGRSY